MSTEKTTVEEGHERHEHPQPHLKADQRTQRTRTVFKTVGLAKSRSAARVRFLLLGRHSSDGNPVTWVRKGLPLTSVARIRKKLKIPEAEVLSLMGMSKKTFKHRQQEHEDLNPIESDRLYRLAKIEAQAVEVFEDEDIAANWLKTPNRALGEKPMNLLDTDAGTDMVERLLTRIEYGVYS
jgi:putative toxin-antitoxin system antitoxin component (TIGR02293 family)